MAARRAGQPIDNLTNGPGKLCQALAIDRALNGHDLTAGRDLWIEPGEQVADAAVSATPRINVGGDVRALSAAVAPGCPTRLAWPAKLFEFFATQR